MTKEISTQEMLSDLNITETGALKQEKTGNNAIAIQNNTESAIAHIKTAHMYAGFNGEIGLQTVYETAYHILTGEYLA